MSDILTPADINNVFDTAEAAGHLDYELRQLQKRPPVVEALRSATPDHEAALNLYNARRTLGDVARRIDELLGKDDK